MTATASAAFNRNVNAVLYYVGIDRSLSSTNSLLSIQFSIISACVLLFRQYLLFMVLKCRTMYECARNCSRCVWLPLLLGYTFSLRHSSFNCLNKMEFASDYSFYHLNNNKGVLRSILWISVVCHREIHTQTRRKYYHYQYMCIKYKTSCSQMYYDVRSTHVCYCCRLTPNVLQNIES